MDKKRVFIVLFGVLIALAVIYGVYRIKLDNESYITYDTFLNDIEEGRVSKVFLSDSDRIKISYKNDDRHITDNPRKDSFKEELLVKGITVDEVDDNLQLAKGLITMVILGVLVYVVLFHMKSGNLQMQKGSKKFSDIDTDQIDAIDIVFDDIAGNDEAKESVKEVVDFINNPSKYARYGARLPRGVIFYGPPGTGKTLMAKA